MKLKQMSPIEIERRLFERYPELESCREDFEKAYGVLLECYSNGGKLLVAGNGGSAADSEHIVGELMKSFLFKRKIDGQFEQRMGSLFGDAGKKVSEKLEGALPAIPLPSMTALTSAFSNDVDAAAAFSQMVYGYGRPGDVLLGISTSGNSENVIDALMVAKAKGLATVALTGETGGRCRELSDVTIRVPKTETFEIQELHLPIYHALCAMLEAEIF